MAYNAIITTITTKPHPNADRIQLGGIIKSDDSIVDMEEAS